MSDMDKSALSGYIRRRMRELGIDRQADLARRAGISSGGLSHILNKKDGVLSRPGTVERLAQALEVEPAEITSRMGYVIDNVPAADANAMRLARAIEARPWMAARKDLLLSLSQNEFEELMDLAEFRKGRKPEEKPKKKRRRKGRPNPDSQ